MNDPIKQLDSKALAEDLARVVDRPTEVPAEVDQAILEHAARHLAEMGQPAGAVAGRISRRFSWVAAASFMLAGGWLAFVLTSRQSPGPSTSGPSSAQPPAIAEADDVDGNGRVDILDAFALARRIDRAGSSEGQPGQFDLNGDDVVDDRDVEIIAARAVSLGKEASG